MRVYQVAVQCVTAVTSVPVGAHTANTIGRHVVGTRGDFTTSVSLQGFASVGQPLSVRQNDSVLATDMVRASVPVPPHAA